MSVDQHDNHHDQLRQGHCKTNSCDSQAKSNYEKIAKQYVAYSTHKPRVKGHWIHAKVVEEPSLDVIQTCQKQARKVDINIMLSKADCFGVLANWN